MQAKGVACISKGRFFWFVEGRVLYIYLASGNQKNRPFGAIPLFPRNQPLLKMSPIGIQPPPPVSATTGLFHRCSHPDFNLFLTHSIQQFATLPLDIRV